MLLATYYAMLKMFKNFDLIYRLTSKSVDKYCITEDPLDFEFFDTIARL